MKLQRLTQDYIFKDFDCGNEDLNDFLFNDSKRYMKSRLAVTYIIESEDTTIGYFSLSNDKLTIREVDKSSWRRIKQLFSHSKHRCDYPAVKVGRLAVDKRYQGKDIGSDILNFIKSMFVYENRTGCVFVTVDALRESLPFYMKNRFKCIDCKQIELDSTTVPLYYNLNELD